jgi:predicted ATPase
MIEERMEIVHLDARADFRLEKLGDQTVYFVPADGHAADAPSTRSTTGVSSSLLPLRPSRPSFI